MLSQHFRYKNEKKLNKKNKSTNHDIIVFYIALLSEGQSMLSY